MGFMSSPSYARSNPLASALQPDLGGLVPNFGVVSPQLWRGGVPKQGGIAELKKAGVKTIVNLMQDGQAVENERATARDLGMNFVHLPLNHFKVIKKDQVEKYLSVVRDPVNQPVFVHCNQGQDRAGTMVAIYRISEEGWSANKAYDEMLSYGFHPFFLGLTSSVYATANDVGRPEAMPSPTHIVTDLKTRFKRALSSI
jgi:protein tyrosine/serine phosphatase